MKQEIARPPSDAETFARVRLKALKIAETILDLPNDLDAFAGNQREQHRRLALQARMAESVIADAIKVDDKALRHQEKQDTLELIRERLQAVKIPERPH